MPEVRLIDANALAESDMAKLIDKYLYNQCNLTVGLAAALMPEIEAEPVRHGRWAKVDDKQYCTNCRAVTKVRNAPFCWHCGAKIDLRTPTEVALDIADSVMMGGADNG